MAITLTANGWRINSGTEVTAVQSAVNTYESGENGTRQNINMQTATDQREMMWECVSNFTKKTSSSAIIIEGSTVGMDDYSHPYGGTIIRVRHSDGTIYDKTWGTAYIANTGGNHVIIWFTTAWFSGGELGNKTGDFDVFWGYGSNSGGSNKPWEQEWNWNSSEDGRAQQQGSHTAVYELEP